MKNLKRNLLVATSAAAAMSVAFAAPSFAHPRGAQGAATSGTVTRVAEAAHQHATVAASITDIPATVTVVRDIVRGAKFVAYKLDAAATVLPAAQPTTGGKPLKVQATVSATGVVSYQVSIDALATAGVAKYAVYNAAGVGSLVTVTTDAAGAATATASVALTTAYAAPTAPALGEGKSVKGERGKKMGHRR